MAYLKDKIQECGILGMNAGKETNNKTDTRLEDYLSYYFSSGAFAKQGPSSVVHIAGVLNISPGSLSRLLNPLPVRTRRSICAIRPGAQKKAGVNFPTIKLK